MIGLLADVDPLPPLAALIELVGVVIFVIRLAPDVRRVSWTTRGPGRYAAAAGMAIVGNIVFINYLAAANEGDFDLVAEHQLLALDHMMFIGVLTNAIFAMLALATLTDVRWPRVDDFVFWGMNLGLVGFFVSLLAESTALEQIATPLMGVAITVGLVEHTLRLGTHATVGVTAAARRPSGLARHSLATPYSDGGAQPRVAASGDATAHRRDSRARSDPEARPPRTEDALTSSLGWSIVRAVGEADADDDIRVVALTSNGDAFCSGLDLGGGDARRSRRGCPTGTGARREGMGRPVPRGAAVRHRQARRRRDQRGGRGCGPLAGDGRRHPHRSRHARLHPGYLRAGTSPDGGLTWSLPTLVGHETAIRFLLESRFVDAEEALRRGFVSEVVPSDQLQARLLELCEAIAAQAPLGVRRKKRLVARTPLVTDVDARVAATIRNTSPASPARTARRLLDPVASRHRPRNSGARFSMIARTASCPSSLSRPASALRISSVTRASTSVTSGVLATRRFVRRTASGAWAAIGCAELQQPRVELVGGDDLRHQPDGGGPRRRPRTGTRAGSAWRSRDRRGSAATR